MTRWYVTFLIFLVGALVAEVWWDLKVAHASTEPAAILHSPRAYEFAPLIIRAKRRRKARSQPCRGCERAYAARVEEPGQAPWRPYEQLCHVYGPRADGLRVAVCGGSVTHYIVGREAPFEWVPVQRF